MAQYRKKYKRPHRMWRARKELGLTQQQLAYLLGHKHKNIVNRIERGLQLPSLKTALILECTLSIPIKVLFSHLYKEVQNNVKVRLESAPEPYQQLNREAFDEVCSFIDLLNLQNLTREQKDKLRNHITFLAKKYAYL